MSANGCVFIMLVRIMLVRFFFSKLSVSANGCVCVFFWHAVSNGEHRRGLAEERTSCLDNREPVVAVGEAAYMHKSNEAGQTGLQNSSLNSRAPYPYLDPASDPDLDPAPDPDLHRQTQELARR